MNSARNKAGGLAALMAQGLLSATERWRPRRLARRRPRRRTGTPSILADNKTPGQASRSAARTPPSQPAGLYVPGTWWTGGRRHGGHPKKRTVSGERKLLDGV